VIVPRHPARGPHIAEALKPWRCALRSKKEKIGKETQIYIADSLGELGLFYRLSGIVFMGGSLVKHGGQNPLEPARLGCAVVAGPHTDNFWQIYGEMELIGAALRAESAEGLAAQIDLLLNQSATRTTMQTIARNWVESQGGTAARILDKLAPVFGV